MPCLNPSITVIISVTIQILSLHALLNDYIYVLIALIDVLLPTRRHTQNIIHLTSHSTLTRIPTHSPDKQYTNKDLRVCLII